jgi:hypothetical protein
LCKTSLGRLELGLWQKADLKGQRETHNSACSWELPNKILCCRNR